MGGEQVYQQRVTRHLVPCVGQFSVALADDSQWKTLNYQVLLKTRHSDAKVRTPARSRPLLWSHDQPFVPWASPLRLHTGFFVCMSFLDSCGELFWYKQAHESFFSPYLEPKL